MIPRQFFFFWGQNTALPYTRYLTMATCRLQHPDAPMYLYQCRCADRDHWGCGIFVDFQFNGEELNKLTPAGQKFIHPGGDLDENPTCNDCHTGGR